MIHTGEADHQWRGRPIRVAFFAGSMRPGHDGVTRVLYRTIDALNERGIQSIFFSPLVPEEKLLPVPIRKVPSVAFPLYKDYRFAMPGIGHFEDELRAFRPDLLHIHSPCSLGYAGVNFGRRFGIPVVATYHTHFASYAKYYKISPLEMFTWNYLRGLYNRCQRVYVPSLPITRELEGRGIQNLEFLPHGVDTEAFSPRFRSHQWRVSVSPEGKSILLYAGRLVWEKDLRTLIGAYDLLRSRRSDWVLALAGDGPIKDQLQAAMPEAVFLGHLSGTELSTAYSSSDLFVFPSTTETFGNVTIEAMASGIPPICAREGGAYAILKDGITGYVTTPRDPADIARCVEDLLDNPLRRESMSVSALEFARTQAWDRIFDMLFASYEDVLDQFSRPRPLTSKKAA